MLLKDHVNLTGQNPLMGPNPQGLDGLPLGPRFPNLSQAYDPTLRRKLGAHLKQNGMIVPEGIYLGLLGPSFETPAEIQLFAKWGLDAVGMSTVWEAIALAHAGAQTACISVMSNLACGLSEESLDHERILKVSRASARKIIASLFSFAEQEFTAHA